MANSKRQREWLEQLNKWLTKNKIVDVEQLNSTTEEITQRVRDAAEAVVRYSADTQTNSFDQFTRVASHLREINRERDDSRGDWLSQTVDTLIALTDRENEPITQPDSTNEHVVLLHGLSRSYLSMARIDQNLRNRGYEVSNIDYPSLSMTIEELVDGSVKDVVESISAECSKIHFITHSMGGLLVRHYLKEYPLDRIGRVVMLSPPNQGSKLADHFSNNPIYMPLYERINGPAGLQLGTDPDSLPSRLGPVDFELGVISGTRSVSPYLSSLIGEANDGKVAVENTKVEGMKDMLLVPTNHTFMMQEPAVIEQAIYFIQHGVFMRQ